MREPHIWKQLQVSVFDFYEMFSSSQPQQNPSLAQVKIEEAKRELVSILIVHSVMD